jgi:hypothetical protein
LGKWGLGDLGKWGLGEFYQNYVFQIFRTK